MSVSLEIENKLLADVLTEYIGSSDVPPENLISTSCCSCALKEGNDTLCTWNVVDDGGLVEMYNMSTSLDLVVSRDIKVRALHTSGSHTTLPTSQDLLQLVSGHVEKVAMSSSKPHLLRLPPESPCQR